MLLYYGFLLYFLSCDISAEINYSYGVKESDISSYHRFSLWPSVHNAAAIMKVRKRQVEKAAPDTNEMPQAQEEHKAQITSNAVPSPAQAVPAQVSQKTQQAHNELPSVITPEVAQSEGGSLEMPKQPVESEKSKAKEEIGTKLEASKTVNTPNNKSDSVQPPVPPVVKNVTDSKNDTNSQTAPNQLDLNNPGVMKRGLIVFGGFALLAVAYFVFYRTKKKNKDSNNTHSIIEGNQFRYGVLHSDDRRDNLELSRMPLTMESDDDDDDLDIFDLEQKKKSLSYVNLQHDEEPISNFSDNIEHDRDNLLLDIEDRGSDPLINWSSSAQKFSI